MFQVVRFPLSAKKKYVFLIVNYFCRVSESIDDLKMLYEEKKNKILGKQQKYKASRKKLDVSRMVFTTWVYGLKAPPLFLYFTLHIYIYIDIYSCNSIGLKALK